MTTLADRPNAALVVIDVQRDVMAGAHAGAEVVATIAGLVERARRAGVAVIWVQHHDEELVRGSSGWALAPGLVRMGGEVLVEKAYGDSFEDTTLEAVLGSLRVGRLVVVGAETDACVRSTLHGAIVRGYDVCLVGDAHTTNDRSEWGAPPPPAVIAHTNLYWSGQSAPGRRGEVVASADLDLSSLQP